MFTSPPIKAKVTTETNTEELLSGILEIGPSKFFSGLLLSMSLISVATSLGPEPGGNAPKDTRK